MRVTFSTTRFTGAPTAQDDARAYARFTPQRLDSSTAAAKSGTARQTEIGTSAPFYVPFTTAPDRLPMLGARRALHPAASDVFPNCEVAV
ncbi:hypothetical protein XAP412_870010 [Xanthomonas phaseoli pv. phaseoli]|uniref:Secreted protein n=1 Tax=Xanthomonas campestris pv. phaseoli TaxID=317013 RepID=A0ABY1TY47_XANCH|nr:hypothetical protein XAP6984_900010 [Xanthomonas phaseoli pv. phaseoli]SON91152.1 hypothetical protein XAP412_870010 [Xanthomonas phaseoli pv. phaseoli]SOO29775.1 hypothetical protein XAP6164_3610005 [Xanthomonas phaseoli pv. phaseoli]